MVVFKDDVVGWDLDSTVFDTQHRQHMVPEIKAGNGTWEEYSLACTGDTPILASLVAMRVMRQSSHVAISARYMCAFDATWNVVREHSVPLEEIYLRPDGDNTDNGVFKVAKLRQLEAMGYHFRLFVEDWPETAAYIRQHTGIPVLVVNPCYPEKPGWGNV